MIDGTAQVVEGDARDLAFLATGSVDLIVSSPPYWAQRSYKNAGDHYDGQIGDEPSALAYVDELVEMIDTEWRRVLRPDGCLWLNLGDKYAGSGGAGTTSQLGGQPQHHRNAPRRYEQGLDVARPKSLIGLPWRVALALIDRGWILRRDLIWSKPNGMPESVGDRPRSSHEYWFLLTLTEKHYGTLDPIREPYRTNHDHEPPIGGTRTTTETGHRYNSNTPPRNPLGRLPGSVWEIATQPLTTPDYVLELEDRPPQLVSASAAWTMTEAAVLAGATTARLRTLDHFAAFPLELPRRMILGWSPPAVCTVCDQPAVPECFCPEISDELRPAVVLDPFGGTGTTAGTARILGRHGVSVDLSSDYCLLAKWRIFESDHFQSALARTLTANQGTLEL